MKKNNIHLIVLAVATTLASTAQAESQLTLYGTVDGGIAVQKVSGGDAKVNFGSGYMSGSVWGLRGQEDLGNGTSINFRLENGFQLDSGSALEKGSSWAKQATLGVVGHFGEVAFGRMGGLSSDEGSYSILQGSSFATNYTEGAINTAFILAPIMNNAIVYQTPDFNGFKVHAQYSNGVWDDSEKFSKNFHYYGLGLTYETEAFHLSAIVEVEDNHDLKAESQWGGYGTPKNTYRYTLGGSYDFGVASVFAAYQYTQHAMSIPSLGDHSITRDYLLGLGANQHAVSLGADIPFAGGSAKFALNYVKGKVNGLEGEQAISSTGFNKYDRFSVGAAYEYPLSKHTTVYGFSGWSDGGKLMNTESSYGDKTYDSWSLGFGLNHQF